MTDLPALKELLERVERAEGPDREIDGRVWCAIGGLPFVMWDGAGCVYRGEHGIGHVQADQVPRYTSSIDACVALIEKVLPGHDWQCISCGSHGASAFVYEHDRLDDTQTFGLAQTPPLAIMVAILRVLLSALIAKEESNAARLP